ncbi:MAG: D-amino-acid oxidase [Sphingomonadales bacterium 32-68-7]|nr:MAG: D-amino-acid oxidase [Sphingomonadales bacterium 12-68-11]OYX09365.1 MAG: D-amino-acid oxidase [Sphingomonadales bacterium 32-68-7]
MAATELTRTRPLAPGIDRRRMMGGSLASGLALWGLGGCSPARVASTPLAWDPRALAPIRVAPDRVFDITVCLRPFRAAGPRLDTETIGDKLVVHNYGHGGSGWSLSWGSGEIAVRQAMAASPREIAVIGCGALGLTAATVAQRAGTKVTIYTRDLLPQSRSARATGTWSPDSRVGLADQVPADFPATWEAMTRTSWKMFRSYLGLPGTPVEWLDRYSVSDTEMAPGRRERPGPLQFAHYDERVRDLTPRRETMAPGSTPFGAPFVYRNQSLMFNVANYGHTLLTDFLAGGGTLKRREFHSPAEFAALPEPVIINCPGYGARALWRDETVVPVRGQIAWLIPQPELTYGVSYRDVNVLPRRDGIAVQAVEGGDMKGYNDANETVDRAESDMAIGRIQELFRRFGPAAG